MKKHRIKRNTRQPKIKRYYTAAADPDTACWGCTVDYVVVGCPIHDPPKGDNEIVEVFKDGEYRYRARFDVEETERKGNE